MRAALLHGFGDLRVEDVPDPAPGPTDVVVAVDCVQPSVTECMLIAGDDVALHEHLRDRLRAGPVPFGGHEFAGTVAALGSSVRGVRLGDRVTAVETAVCGTCYPCRAGLSAQCTSPEYLGFTRPGAFATHVVVPAACLVALPDEVTAGQAAAVQPLVGAIHAHAAAHVRPGESVLVLGAGVMGLHAVQLARHGQGGLVMATGRSAAKRELARQLGADLVLDAADDVAALVREATRGVGADVVIETAGGMPSAGLAGTATLDLAVASVRRGGRVVVVSVLPSRAEGPFGALRERAVSLIHPGSGTGDHGVAESTFDYALRLIARGDVDVDALVTHRMSGIDALPTAIAVTADKQAHGAINPVQVDIRVGRAA